MSFDRDTDKFRTFGRAKGRRLSPHMQAVWDEVFPKLKWDISAPLPIGALWLEIGFGGWRRTVFKRYGESRARCA